MTNLNAAELARYNRHIILPDVGLVGQQRLKQAKVLCIGTGGLGSPIALYLAAVGIGTLGLVDFDVVEDSNLQRQIIHSIANIGKLKVESARDTLLGINQFLNINTYDTGITTANVRTIIAQYDVVIDGTDNFPTRYLVNDACVLEGKPLVYASIFQFEGQATVFNYKNGPCYRCLYSAPPPLGLVPSCNEGGVLGVLPGIIGVMQATEAIKIVLDIGNTLSGRLMLYDALAMKFREVKLRKDPQCPACGDNPSIGDVSAYEDFCGLPPTEKQKEEVIMTKDDINPKELQALREQSPKLFIVDVRENNELQICKIDGTVHIPLGSIAEQYLQIPKDEPVVVHCKLGGRSAQAMSFLQSKGYTQVKNLAGGIIAWIDDIDNSLQKY
ncbi:MAG: molybdopterin-synthase adenylyltransferase MoeB [Mariprofundales bacterium]